MEHWQGNGPASRRIWRTRKAKFRHCYRNSTEHAVEASIVFQITNGGDNGLKVVVALDARILYVLHASQSFPATVRRWIWSPTRDMEGIGSLGVLVSALNSRTTAVRHESFALYMFA